MNVGLFAAFALVVALCAQAGAGTFWSRVYRSNAWLGLQRAAVRLGLTPSTSLSSPSAHGKIVPMSNRDPRYFEPLAERPGLVFDSSVSDAQKAAFEKALIAYPAKAQSFASDALGRWVPREFLGNVLFRVESAQTTLNGIGYAFTIVYENPRDSRGPYIAFVGNDGRLTFP